VQASADDAREPGRRYRCGVRLWRANADVVAMPSNEDPPKLPGPEPPRQGPLLEVVKLLLAARSGSFADRAWRIVSVHLVWMLLNFDDGIAAQWYRLLLCAGCIGVVFVYQLLAEHFLQRK
jgi:hypothetical protein